MAKLRVLFLVAVVTAACVVNRVNGAHDGDEIVADQRESFRDACGVNMKWSYTERVLYISGSGAMCDYNPSFRPPWYKIRGRFYDVVVDGVSSIGNYGFSFPNLQRVNISASVTSIHDSAFAECNEKILFNVAEDNPSYSSIDGTLYNKDRTFLIRYYSNTETFSIPDTVETIKNDAFSNCFNLKVLVVPASVKSIGEKQFTSCSSLTSIQVEEGNQNYRSIDGVLFDHDYKSLIVYPLGIKNETYIVPTTVTSIADGAFYASSVKSVSLSNVETIGNEAFAFAALNNVNIPVSVKSIGYRAFAECGSLAKIEVAEGNTQYSSDDDVLFDKVLKKLITYPQRKSGTYEVPNYVKIIEDYAFYECRVLNGVTISANVESIGAYAFSHCFNMKTLNIAPGSKLQSIGDNGFSWIDVSEIVIADSVTTIGSEAYSGCSSVTNVTIPESVTTIGENAFGSELTKLTWIEVKEGNKYFKSVDGVLFDRDVKTLIRYPPGRVDQTYSIPNSVTKIADNGFEYCRNIVNITIGDKVETIGDYGFYYCSSLSGVTIPDSVKTIGDHAFHGCFFLKTLENGANVVTMGDYAFSQCSKLETVAIGDHVKILGMSVFSSCKMLTNVRIGDSVETIGDYAFQFCDSLTNVTIGDNVVRIGDNAFESCHQLVHMTIPDSVTSIGVCAFRYCDGITDMNIGSGVTSIGHLAFYSCKKLKSIFYQGTTYVSLPFDQPIFGSDVPDNVCVPVEYTFNEFCGLQVTPTNPACKDFQLLFDRCYKGAYVDGRVTEQKRKNATDWEKRTTECIEYQCDNNSGGLAWVICKHSEENNVMCLDSRCVDEEKEGPSDKQAVELVVKDMEAKEIDIDELEELILVQCGIEDGSITIGWEMNEDGTIIRILVYFDDVEIGQKVLAFFNEQGISCARCQILSTRIIEALHGISGSISVNSFYGTILSILFVAYIMFH